MYISRFKFVLSNLRQYSLATNSKVNMEYEESIKLLNKLQSNQSNIEEIRRDLKYGKKCTNLEDMTAFLKRIGISSEDLKQLSIIHIAGTKGKGTTSALCESILRHHGYKTGFYSSPHLVSVRERIRLNGQIISKSDFGKHFCYVYNKLKYSQVSEKDMPKYFAFLTILAIHIFLKEQIDVAIVEVGIGGVVDYTNVVNNVPVVGITSLGLDHTSILGSTIEEIAAAKAGIIKFSCQAYTVCQKDKAMDVLNDVAETQQSTMAIVPNYSEYRFSHNYKPNLKVNTEAYKSNASLAIQLSHCWIRQNNLKNKSKIINGNMEDSRNLIYDLPIETCHAIESCVWPGRFQIMHLLPITFYLDGAHTEESMTACFSWFQKNAKNKKQYLVFTSTGDRDAQVMLNILSKQSFDKAYFVPPLAYDSMTTDHDNFSHVDRSALIKRCENNAKCWQKYGGKYVVCQSVAAVLDELKTNEQIDVLVTGSLHLIGAALTILDPDLNK